MFAILQGSAGLGALAGNSQPDKGIKIPACSGAITRREFVGRTLAMGIISGAPAFLRGQNLNNKLNIAFIACVGRPNASFAELTVVPGSGQAGASILATLQGTVERATYLGLPPKLERRTRAINVRQTFQIAPAAGRYLIVASIAA